MTATISSPICLPSSLRPTRIEEFRVITNSFDAEYGRNSGAVVNVVTKSGTNAIHGSFYEFFRNDVLNAHPFTFFPAPKPEFRQNQFGGTLGGPIRKDKTFFFGSYEGRRIVQGIVSQPISVPTAAEVTNGDFSAAGLANGVVDANGNPGFAGIAFGRDCRQHSPDALRIELERPRSGCRRVGRGRRSRQCPTAQSFRISRFRRPASILSR